MGWLTRTQSTTRDDKNDQLDNNTDRDTNTKTSTRSDVNVSLRMRTNTPESSDSDNNKLTSEERRTEVVLGEKKKTRYSDRISAFGRQMGWLSTSTGKSSDYNDSDTNTTNLLPNDESESSLKLRVKGQRQILWNTIKNTIQRWRRISILHYVLRLRLSQLLRRRVMLFVLAHWNLAVKWAGCLRMYSICT